MEIFQRTLSFRSQGNRLTALLPESECKSTAFIQYKPNLFRSFFLENFKDRWQSAINHLIRYIKIFSDFFKITILCQNKRRKFTLENFIGWTGTHRWAGRKKRFSPQRRSFRVYNLISMQRANGEWHFAGRSCSRDKATRTIRIMPLLGWRHRLNICDRGVAHSAKRASHLRNRVCCLRNRSPHLPKRNCPLHNRPSQLPKWNCPLSKRPSQLPKRNCPLSNLTSELVETGLLLEHDFNLYMEWTLVLVATGVFHLRIWKDVTIPSTK